MLKKFKRFSSVVLAFILCVTCFNIVPVYANEDIENSAEQCYNEIGNIVANEKTGKSAVSETFVEQAEELVLSDTFMSYIDKSEFESHNFTKRLVEQEKLNTYVFQNDDNTRTIYYFDENLKYIDDKGQVVEKDLSIIEAENGYTIKKSDIDINLPTTPTLGIAVGYDNYSISIIPISTSKITSLENIKAERSDGSIVYNGVFGSNTKLVYTPILSGLKEDIVLSEYVPNAKFAFTIKTNGLSIVENDGQYLLAETAKSEPIFRLGDVMVYDAVGKPSIGTMTVKTVKDYSEYIVTLEVDEEFLKDSGTVYPVTIDPSITVSDNTNGAGAIEDAPIYEGYPDTNFGAYLYNPVGTPSADFGKGRTVVRLTGLISSDEYENITANQITNVTFYVKEGSGSSQNVYISPIVLGNLTWTESNIKWNNVGMTMPLASYGGFLTGGQWSAIDITSLVKYWKTDEYPASGGFLMKGYDESINRSFLSSEYSSTSYRPYVVMTYEGEVGGDNIANAYIISLNTYYPVNIDTNYTLKYFKFIPETTGFYTFESTSNSSSNPYGTLYNSSGNEIANNNDGASNGNFRLTYHLRSGVPYYFAASCHSNFTGTYDFRVIATTTSSYVSASVLGITSPPTVSTTFPYEAKYYKITPSVTREYLFISSDASGDPKIWIYNSSLTLIGNDDDSAGDYNFKLSITFTAGQTYYIVANQYTNNTGSYKLNLLSSGTVSNGVYYLRNISTAQYMDIHGPVEQEWVQQWNLHSGLQEKWNFQKQSDGYYTIRSQYGNKYYMGISSTITGIDNVKLYSSVSDNTKWRIYEDSLGRIILEPKTATNKVLCVPNSNAGTELQLSHISTSIGNKSLWRPLTIGEYISYVNNYFDEGYSVYYNESRATSINQINNYIDEIAARYYDLFGLTLFYNNASYYESPIDICKGNVSSSNINTECDHSGTKHTERGEVLNSFMSSYSGSDTLTNVLWSCHRISSGESEYNRSCATFGTILMLEQSTQYNKDQDTKGVLMHELNHAYGAPDHYHELSNKNDNGSCIHKEICSTCGINKRPGSCIMNTSRIDIWNTDVICSECKDDIIAHLNLHHTN